MNIVIVTTLADKLIKYRKELILDILNKGHTITVLGSEPYDVCSKELNPYNISYIKLNFSRININPFKEIMYIVNVAKTLKTLKVNTILVYGIRLCPCIAIASKLCNLNNVYSIINGTGTLFFIKGLKGTLLRLLTYPLLFLGLHFCKKVIFQNIDNKNLFIKKFFISKFKTHLVNGSGVNLQNFKATPLPSDNVFLFIGRIVQDKGIFEFVNAAKIVKDLYPDSKFIVIGSYDNSLTSINKDFLNRYIKDEIINYIPYTDKVNDYLNSCSAFVLPSYHEGVPRCVLEAMAVGRPIITTNAPGCKETVVDGLNGFLVPVKDVCQLAEKIIWIIKNKDKAALMGKESLKICKNKFNIQEVNQQIISILEL